ncbi:tail assembly chaperone [Haloarcula californiae tailed virus 2]|uniref:Tail assembly chaperone n=1 Tax=Haloarcula californiae tailed virus 2 TaxID=1273747 RepID=R4THM5_9CAUD|nr:tail assembly chaperone [Haloarcula californiae tailed virus 2]AGM11811.1 tail assembly chaperone [Haloarcula californiae tailed virus 2]
MGDQNERHGGETGHSNTGLPPAVRDALPERYQDQADDFSVASDHMDATVQNSSTETVTLVDDREGEVYVLEMADITWQQVNSALTDALVPEAGGQGGKLDFGAYYRQVAEAKIQSVQPEVPEEQMATWLTGLNERLGSQLQQHLPDPVDDIQEQEAKN